MRLRHEVVLALLLLPMPSIAAPGAAETAEAYHEPDYHEPDYHEPVYHEPGGGAPVARHVVRSRRLAPDTGRSAQARDALGPAVGVGSLAGMPAGSGPGYGYASPGPLPGQAPDASREAVGRELEAARDRAVGDNIYGYEQSWLAQHLPNAAAGWTASTGNSFGIVAPGDGRSGIGLPR